MTIDIHMYPIASGWIESWATPYFWKSFFFPTFFFLFFSASLGDPVNYYLMRGELCSVIVLEKWA
ncbi:hypothetical protein BO94DRAFT_504562 [Aspergillus sclerotioniger CBS 115572]|uniref:Uncharacterized protein n=1 Tax=Aspergillus sclerotioniger CBS 115572 TaxID=1450535 RepID=A0A317V1J4_9EURO|nr:hypothetical protein BO94DRAFT_504562 [Aspergillus sclerotioniger CBS 115572]PWY66060.1 hypothetical protein BO94DRAFT_504562 [Aspergillus sclerotioniger CBS 115572]